MTEPVRRQGIPDTETDGTEDPPTTPPEPRETVETPAYAAAMYRMLAAWGRRVADGDVEDLADLVAFEDEVKHTTRQAIAAARAAQPDPRDSAWSWQRIGDGLGITKQSAQERFDR